MKITVCDRCRTEINGPNSVIYLTVRRIKYDIGDDYELCERCASELKIWLNGKKEENDE